MTFCPAKKLYLKGSSALIGNSIVSTDAIKPYEGNSFNDILKLKYIDVDRNHKTFSSSQANLEIAQKDLEIKYAALYWSAIYKYDKGYTKTINIKGKKNLKKIIYEGNNVRSKNINTILFKTPNSDYNTINGTVIYDSYNNEKSFPEIKPYVCFADVTSLIKNSKTLNGTYTVANIKATEGYVSGGTSGGWLLYIIYETKTDKPKHFTIYDGFINVFKTPVNIVFDNFKTPESGVTKASLILGALEGDNKFKSDNCAFFNYEKKEYIPLFNKIRPRFNFFNSSISINNSLYTDRTPNSQNTLGFDLLKIDIPNLNNSVISNNQTEATVRFKSKADQFYLFFVSFETEISPIFLEGKNNKETLVVLNDEKDDVPETIDEEENIEPVIETQKPAKKPKKASPLDKIKNLKSITIPNIPKGYYLVTNVFSVKDNATKWKQFLKDKGHNPKSYVNPKNGWEYIYLKNDEDPLSIYLKHKELSKLSYFEAIWVLKINF